MIISHKYKFIFIKTKKTAGTSIEVYLSQFCGEDDIVTPIFPIEEKHRPQNYLGRFNFLKELFMTRGRGIRKTLSSFFKNQKFYNHIPAIAVKARIDKETWDTYYKFCVERDPWSKSISHYNMLKYRKTKKINNFDDYLKNKSCFNYPQYMNNSYSDVIVDKIIDYKNLIKELGVVFAKIGIPYNGNLTVQTKHKYKGTSGKEKFNLTKQQIKKIRIKYSKEIKLLGFDYE